MIKYYKKNQKVNHYKEECSCNNMRKYFRKKRVKNSSANIN